MTDDSAYLSRYDDEHGEHEWNRLDVPETRRALLAWEESFCRESGALVGGTHVVAVACETALDS